MGSLHTYAQIKSVVVVVPCMVTMFEACNNAACPKCDGKGEYQTIIPFHQFITLVNEENSTDEE